MRKYLCRDIFLIGILAGAVLTTDIVAQTVIVNAEPVLITETESIDYTDDVDSAIMEYLFDQGYIIFSQSSEDSVETLRALGKQTGADIVISWAMHVNRLSGILIDCETGRHSPPLFVNQSEFGSEADLHKMYSQMGSRLCEQLIQEDWN